MNLRDYIKSLGPDGRKEYARRSGTTEAYLFQIAGGHSKPSGQLTRRLAQESGFLVSPQELRPDIFGNPSPSIPVLTAASACLG
jgi:transcriptional regulator with XRE-family HTH domain